MRSRSIFDKRGEAFLTFFFATFPIGSQSARCSRRQHALALVCRSRDQGARLPLQRAQTPILHALQSCPAREVQHLYNFGPKTEYLLEF